MSLSIINENTREEGQDSMNTRIPELCSNLNIRICIDKELYDYVLSYYEVIYVQHVRDCLCYVNNPNYNVLTVYNKNGRITIRDVLIELENQQFDIHCKHVFLEDIDHVRYNLFEFIFSS